MRHKDYKHIFRQKLREYTTTSEYRKLRKTNPIYNDKGNGEWGYLVNGTYGYVGDYMQEHGLKSLIDLGAGIGHGIEILNEYGFKARGFDNEDELIAEHQKVFNNNHVTKKDILLLNKEDIEEYDVIYFWQPIKDENIFDIFLVRLLHIAQPNQVILMRKDNNQYYRVVRKLYLEKFTKKKVTKYGDLEVLKI